jgi:membrane protein
MSKDRGTSDPGLAPEEPNPASRAEMKVRTTRQALVAKERRVVGRGSRAAERVKTGAAGVAWTRLNAVDFMNSSLQFAALGVLCLFPFLILISAGTGHDLRQTLIIRMGLDHHAAQDVNGLISAGNHAVTTLDVFGGVLVILGAIGIASTLQGWYERVYGLPPARTWWRQLANRLLWLAGFVFYLASQELIGRELSGVAGRIPIYVVTFVIALVFYTWTLHVLLLGRLRWTELLPGGLTTAVCVTGLGVFSSLLFSGQIVSSDSDYGPIGVMMILLSYLIGVGVCLHLGAVAGRAWNERNAQESPNNNHDGLVGG